MSSNKALSLTAPQSRRECFSIWLLNTTYINDNTVSLKTSTAWLDSSRKRRSPIPGYFLIFILKYLPILAENLRVPSVCPPECSSTRSVMRSDFPLQASDQRFEPVKGKIIMAADS